MRKATIEEVRSGEHWCERGDSWPEHDAQGIYLCRVCPQCVDVRLAQYRPEILTGYGQADVDEPIEPEESTVEEQGYEGQFTEEEIARRYW
jgi:hypothetical protein